MQKNTFLVLCSAVFLISLVSAAQQDVFILTLEYNKGNLSVQNLLVAVGYFTTPVNQPADGYILELISSKSNVLYKQTFDFPLEVHFSPPPREWFDEKGNQVYIPNESETRTIRDTATVELIFPFFEDAARIDVRYPNKTLALSIPVNTEKAGALENVKLDTASATSQEPPTVEKSEKALLSRPLMIIIIAVLVVIIIVIIFVLIHIAHKKEPDGYTY